jgi:hypothetical protein
MSGHDITGFDIEDSMSDRIPRKIVADLKNIRWHKADAVHENWGNGFDVVILGIKKHRNYLSKKLQLHCPRAVMFISTTVPMLQMAHSDSPRTIM